MSWIDLFRRKKTQQQPAPLSKSEPPGDALTKQEEVNQEIENEERLLAAKQQYREGNIAEADAICLEILKYDPEHADATHMVGVVNLGRGQLSEAEKWIRQAIALDDKQVAYHSNLGNVLGTQNRTEEAYECFKQALGLDPQHLGALSNAATALLSMGRASEAKPLCLQVLALAPEDVNIRLNLAAALIEERDVHAAMETLREGLAIQPNNVELLFQLASALEFANQLDEVLALIEQAEAVQPGVARITLLSGVVARRQGDFDVAEQRLQLAIDQGLSEAEKTEAYSQLGLSLDASGRAEEAFAAFERSNQTMFRVVGQQKADGSSYLREVAAIKEFFAEEKIAELRKTFETDDDFQPIFFVGFPRSGTTLMEQVLKAHPKLVTTEERSPLSAVVRQIRTAAGGYPQGLENLTNEDLTRLRKYFRDFCQNTLGELNDKQVVDKLPLNIVHLGLAKLLFPKAKIVVALRDPRDACLSCFMQKFEINHAMANFLDLQTTGLAYQAVMGLWLHYRSNHNDSWLEYRYEDLVENFDETVSQVLEFIGVGWHEEITGYREAAKQRVISTPSYRDVTAPIYNRALARWRKYEQDLTPILPILEPFVEVFGYKK